MYTKLKKVLANKKINYNNMPLRTPSEIVESIEANIPSHFFIDKDTTFYVFDAYQKRSYRFKLMPEDHSLIDQINDIHPFERGNLLYEYTISKDI
jgi:hypothetical protein